MINVTRCWFSLLFSTIRSHQKSPNQLKGEVVSSYISYLSRCKNFSPVFQHNASWLMSYVCCSTKLIQAESLISELWGGCPLRDRSFSFIHTGNVKRKGLEQPCRPTSETKKILTWIKSNCSLWNWCITETHSYVQTLWCRDNLSLLLHKSGPFGTWLEFIWFSVRPS